MKTVKYGVFQRHYIVENNNQKKKHKFVFLHFW